MTTGEVELFEKFNFWLNCVSPILFVLACDQHIHFAGHMPAQWLLIGHRPILLGVGNHLCCHGLSHLTTDGHLKADVDAGPDARLQRFGGSGTKGQALLLLRQKCLRRS